MYFIRRSLFSEFYLPYFQGIIELVWDSFTSVKRHITERQLIFSTGFFSKANRNQKEYCSFNFHAISQLMANDELLKQVLGYNWVKKSCTLSFKLECILISCHDFLCSVMKSPMRTASTRTSVFEIANSALILFCGVFY